MQKVFFLLIIVFWGLSLWGQDVIISDKISVRDDYAFYLLGKQNDQYLLLRDKETDFTVQAFNPNMEKVWAKKVQLDGRRTEIIDAFGNPEGFFVVYQYRKKSQTYLKIHKYDAAAVILDSVIIKSYGVRYNTPFPMIKYSPNKEKILVYHTENGKIVKSISFDTRSMKINWEHDFKLHQDLDRKYLFQPIITNKGDVFLAYEVNNRKSKLSRHEFIVHHKTKNNLKQISFPVPHFLVSDYQFTYNTIHHKLVCVGLFAEKSINRANGVFTFDLQKKQIVKIPFDQKLIASLAGKTSRRKSRGAEDLLISDVISRSDGGTVVLMEKVKIFHRSSIDLPGQFRHSNPSRMSTDYYFEDVFALSISPSGKMDWKTILYKQQTSQNDQGVFSSYFLWQNKNSVRLIFNDEIQRKTNVIEYQLQTNGKAKRNSIFNTSDSNLLLRMRDGLQIAAGEAIFPSQYKRRLKLVLVKW